MSSERTKGLPAVPESFLPREHVFYRPRHSHRQRGALIAATAFFCVPLLLLVVGVRPAEFENRKLAPFPSVTAGWGFFTGLNSWAADHLPLRDRAVAAADGVSRGVFGEPYPFGEKHDTGPVLGLVPDQEAEDVPLTGVEIPRASGFPVVVEGRDNWLYLGYDVQAACQPNKSLDEVFGGLNALRAGVEASGRRFVLVVAPNKATAVPEHLPGSYLGSKCHDAARDEFWRRLVPDTGALDLRAGLRAEGERLGRPVYDKIDTHWTHEGGLVMVRAVAEAVQPGSTTRWRQTEAQVSQVAGDLPTLVGRTQKRPVQVYDLAPDGGTVRSRPVRDDLREPKRFTQPRGSGGVTSKVGLIGDSFAFTMSSYLVGGFADLSMVHSDLVGTDPAKVGRMLAEQDVVVVEAVERSLVAGINTLLAPGAVDAIVGELAKRPR
ncbi:hypothetical protein Q5530_04360 [Saccharothrix sp. BKS2]|uniref:alginate O-acetyltransferase AlgX-related protein n=1 Tax=Saccharothrix sp. BKS2 TaxID=3064400 RepID=UPI0039E868FC